MTQHITPIRRAARPGRPDGTSEVGQYVCRWTDEDSGPHEALMSGASEEAVRDQLEPLVGNNTLVIRRVNG